MCTRTHKQGHNRPSQTWTWTSTRVRAHMHTCTHAHMHTCTHTRPQPASHPPNRAQRHRSISRSNKHLFSKLEYDDDDQSDHQEASVSTGGVVLELPDFGGRDVVSETVRSQYTRWTVARVLTLTLGLNLTNPDIATVAAHANVTCTFTTQEQPHAW